MPENQQKAEPDKIGPIMQQGPAGVDYKDPPLSDVRLLKFS